MSIQIVNIYQAAWGAECGPFEPMPGTTAHGLHLMRTSTFRDAGVELGPDDQLGADIIELGAGETFPLHTHPGHHVLLVIMGQGTVTVDGEVHPTAPGDLYMVDGLQEHAVGAVERHILLSVGVPHKMPTALDRMNTVMERTLVASSEGTHLRDAPTQE